MIPGSVQVVGTGLLGTSVGLALRRRGVEVWLTDRDPAALAMAASLGAGQSGRPPAPVDLVVVAVPPATTAQVVAEHLAAGAAAVTDVASVKSGPTAAVAALASELAGRYVGGHPMAGREISGPRAARSDLFEGRPWVVCPAPGADPRVVALVEGVVDLVGAVLVRMDPVEHDAAVALVSHAPHLVASLVAGRLADAPADHVALAGPGLADITRVAAGDALLWRDILRANTAAVRDVLAGVRDDLDRAMTALAEPAGEHTGDSPRDDLDPLLQAGNTGRARLPGKHGGRRTEFATVPVVVDDRPGQLAALFAAIGAAGANIEDLRIEHSPGQPVGLAEVSVRPEQADGLVAALRASGWTVH